jgi:hypothetical protein
MKTILAAVLMLSLAACASFGDDGWSGAGAEPFDGARESCAAQAGADTGAAFEACMSEKGWTRR